MESIVLALCLKEFTTITKRDSDGNAPYYFPYLPLDMRYHIPFLED